MERGNSLKINLSKIVIFFIALFCIIPEYIQVLGLNLQIWNGLIVITLTMACIWNKGIRIEKYSIKRPYVICFLSFLIVYNIQVFFDSGLKEGVKYILTYTMICICTLIIIDNKERFLQCITYMVDLTGVLCLYGIIEAVTKVNVLHQFSPDYLFYEEIRLGVLRCMTTFYHPITYCAFLIMMSAIVMYLMNVENKSKRTAVICNVVYILIAVNVMLTVSRMAIMIYIVLQIILNWKIGNLYITRKRMIYFIAAVALALFLQLCGAKIIDVLLNFVYMFLAIIQSGYADKITTGTYQNVSGVGDRFMLYEWVIQDLGDKILLGMGTLTEYSHQVNLYNTKFGIEVEYLNILFHHGLVGLVTMLASYGAIIIRTIAKYKTRYTFEGKLGFNPIILFMLSAYYVLLFTVNQSTDFKCYLLVVCLFIIYNSRKFRVNYMENK